jgi:hypothetical protein
MSAGRWSFACRWATVGLLTTCLGAAAGAQEQRPSLSAGRVTGELVAGAYAGVSGFFIGRYIGDRASDALGVQSDVTRHRVRHGTGVVLAGAATAGVVYAIGNIGDETGEFGATALGTTVGLAAAIGLARVVLGPGGRPGEGMSSAGRWATINVIALLPAAGAAVGFASTRRYR